MTLDLRLAVPAVACWAAAWSLTAAPDGALSLAAAAWLAVVAVTGWATIARRRAGSRVPWGGRRHPGWGLLAVGCAGVALVASVVAVVAPQRTPAAVLAAEHAHGSVVATVQVWSVPAAAAALGGFGAGGADTGRMRFRGTLVAVAAGARGTTGQGATVPVPVSVPVVVFAATVPASAPPARIGSMVRLVATLQPTTPGDAAALLVFGSGPPEAVADPPWWLAWAGEVRSRFGTAAAALPGDGGALLPGLAIGDTSAVGDDLDAAMKASSLSHLTAVSGANCAVVIAIIMLLGARLRLPRWARIALSLVVLLAFVVLVTPEPSVLRAAVMAAVLLVGLGLGQPARGVPLLAVSVIALLAGDPWLSRSYGFALSVLATGGLLVLAGPLTRSLARWLPSGLAALIAIPLAAQLACQPVLVLLTPTFPLYGVPANLLAEPAAPLATVVGLAACVLLPWLPGAAGAVLSVAWVPAAWIAAVARTAAALPGSRLPWLGGPVGVALTIVLTMALLVLLLGPERAAAASPARARVRPKRPPRPPRAPRIRARAARPTLDGWSAAAAVVLVVGIGGYAGALLGSGIGRAATFPADWQIAACDIGQGDAVVVRDHSDDGDRYALVDVGPDPRPLAACLATLGITRIDLLVLTHYDLDHVGGAAAVIGKVGTALVGVPENAQDERLHTRLAEGGADVRTAAKGDRGTLGGLAWDILWPVRGSTLMQTGNPGSVTIEFDGRGIRSVFLGDLGQDAQDALDRVSAPGRVDVVKVAHHGSRDQSPRFYQELHASMGLISVGADNGYGHPTAALLDLLASVGTVAVRTDRQGLSVVAPAPAGHGGLVVWTEKAG